jgi:ParB family chromosome partitioning protein
MIIAINDIEIGKRLRGLRETTVTELVDSIGRLGLQVPISVTTGVRKRPNDADDVSFELVAGRHRLEACKRLGWTEIEASIFQMSDDERALWEIDENLCRAELTELERGEHLAKRKPVYERLHPSSKASVGTELAQKRWGDAAENSSVASFAADTAEKIGVTDRAIRQSIRRVKKIDAKLRDRIRDNPQIADSGVELDALAQMEPQQQRKAVALVESGQAAGIRDAKKLIAPKPQSKEAQIRALRERQATPPISKSGAPFCGEQPAEQQRESLKQLLALLKANPKAIIDLDLANRVRHARICLAVLNVKLDDLRDDAA